MKIIDLHNDFLTCIKFSQIESYLKTCKKDGVVCVLASIWTTRMKNPIEFIKKTIDRLREIKTDVKIKIHIEDLGFLSEETIDELLKLNIYSVSLTWNYDNCLAGGAKGKGGLTKLGKLTLKKLYESNIVLDTAHLNRKSFYQVFKLFKGRIFCTHTAFNVVNKHARNLTLKQCQKIIKNNGVIGLCFVDEFLKTTDAKIKDVVKHIKWFIKTSGENSLCLGTDFYGASTPDKLKGYGDFKNLVWEMKRQGIEKNVIDKLLYTNATKFI